MPSASHCLGMENTTSFGEKFTAILALSTGVCGENTTTGGRWVENYKVVEFIFVLTYAANASTKSRYNWHTITLLFPHPRVFNLYHSIIIITSLPLFRFIPRQWTKKGATIRPLPLKGEMHLGQHQSIGSMLHWVSPLLHCSSSNNNNSNSLHFCQIWPLGTLLADWRVTI